jgi:hypothetical protein
MRSCHSALARLVAAGLAAAGLALAPAALPVAPADAHSGGRAQLYVDAVRLEPHPGGWRAALVLRDADSGQPEPGFGVRLAATAPDGRVIGPVDLADPDADGRYAGAIPLTESTWTLTLHAAEIPGGRQAIPFTKTWTTTLQAGQALDLTNSVSPALLRRSAPARSMIPLVLGLMGTAALAGMVGLRLARARRHRRPATTVRWN